MLSVKDQTKLRISCSDKPHLGKDNPELDRVIKQIKQESPWLFHTEATLDNRRFSRPPVAYRPYK